MKSYKGFTLIEVMVSVSIFAMVMLIATGSVFSIVEANKKTHTLKSVMTNLNFALESMAREIRVGFRYACGSSVALSATANCSNGDTTFRFKANHDVDADGNYDAADNNDQVEYSISADNRIMKRVYGNNSSFLAITASEIHITALKFYVTGAGTSEFPGKQPKVVITIQGYAGSDTTQSAFNIETTLSQRAIDS